MDTIRIGIKPGKQTGITAYNATTRKIILCETDTIVGAMETIKDLLEYDETKLELYVDSDKKHKDVYGPAKDKLRCSGTIKRDLEIWKDFCAYHRIDYSPVSYRKQPANMSKSIFSRRTGYGGRTTVQGRQSAMIVVCG